MTGTTDLRGRVAIVTGAGKGLGRAYALELARCGARVLVNNRRHSGEADADTSARRTADAIVAAGGQAEANWCDVCDPDSGRQMVQQARERFGRLDIVVANAGIDRASAFARQSLADYRAIFDTSFFGNLHLVHAAWPHLLEQGYGRVVLTTSSAGLHGNRGQSAYAAAKAAVLGLVRTLALEGRRHNVRVNAIAPYGHSQMTAPYMDAATAQAFDPQRVAPLVAWLCSTDCDVDGQTLVSGAGWLSRADTGETAVVPLRPEHGWARAVQATQALPVQHHASANDAFACFLRAQFPSTSEPT